MEMTTVQAAELSIRLGSLLANHIFSLDSLEALDLTTAMGVLDGKIDVMDSTRNQLEEAEDRVYGYEQDMADIGRELGDRYMDAGEIIEKIQAMQKKIADFGGSL